MRTNVSPRVALRRWPMCAALLGLMLVCSTMIFSVDRGSGRLVHRVQERHAVSRAVETRIDVAIAGDFESRDTVDRRQYPPPAQQRFSWAPAAVAWRAETPRAAPARRSPAAWAARWRSARRRRTVLLCGSETLPEPVFPVDETRTSEYNNRCRRRCLRPKESALLFPRLLRSAPCGQLRSGRWAP